MCQYNSHEVAIVSVTQTVPPPRRFLPVRRCECHLIVCHFDIATSNRLKYTNSACRESHETHKYTTWPVDTHSNHWNWFASWSGKWDLWWTKWCRGRFPPSTSVSPAKNRSFHQLLILTITRGRYNRPVVVAVPSGPSLDSTPQY
jgi:hypothetical protein